MGDDSSEKEATWTVDLTTRQVTRSSNHDWFYGYGENLQFWNIEHFLTHVHPEDQAMFSGAFAKPGQQSFEIEFRVRLPDGSERRLRSKGRISYGADGSARSVSGSTQLA